MTSSASLPPLLMESLLPEVNGPHRKCGRADPACQCRAEILPEPYGWGYSMTLLTLDREGIRAAKTAL